MRWYISSRGQTWGPYEEGQIVEMLRRGIPEVHLRSEYGGDWLPLASSPFAGFVSTHVAHAQAPVRSGTQNSSLLTSVLSRAFITLAALAFVGLLALAVPMLGLLVAIPLLASGIIGARKGFRSITELVLKKPASRALAFVTIAAGAWVTTCSASGYSARLQQENREEKERMAEAEQKRLAAQREAAAVAELKRSIPAKVAKWREVLEKSRTAGESGGSQQDAHDAASSTLTEAKTLAKRVGSVPELDSFLKDTTALLAWLEPRVTFERNIKAVKESAAEAQASMKRGSWIFAEEECSAALSALDSVDGAPEKFPHIIPKDFNPSAQRLTLEGLRKRIAPLAAAEKKRREAAEEKRLKAEAVAAEKEAKAEAAAAAYKAVCGSAPVISSWDGEAVGLQSALAETAHDPDSIDVENCTQPLLTEKACWVTSCNVRGKNAFGALVLNRKTFSKSAGGWQEVR